MGLRIQNNVEAFNAHRQLTGTAAKAAKAMEKLSSGYRINRAADDAAGLAISEKMRGRSVVSPRPSATRRTPSRSCRPLRVPSTRCTPCCSVSAS